MQQVIASDHQEPSAGKTHRDARDEEVELHSAVAMLSSRKREHDATRRAPVTSIQKPCACVRYTTMSIGIIQLGTRKRRDLLREAPSIVRFSPKAENRSRKFENGYKIPAEGQNSRPRK